MGVDLQRIHLKLLAEAPSSFSVDPFLSIFARQRSEQENLECWVDLADYAHMPRGAGMLLVGHRANFSIDLGDPGPGFLYAGKLGLTGSIEKRILETFSRCLALVEVLLKQPEYPNSLEPCWGSWELVINDRLIAPNTAETDTALRSDIETALNVLFGSDNYTAELQNDPRKRYGLSIRAHKIPTLKELKTKLA
ncbi:MAG: hypothetical protein CMN58_06435 [Solibacterales bacterium]|nr:hypothetical protein [Bryobacterales bacterium]|tara:strand:+ start:207246 stop:207827 length:582 start_codon:yes stop_codon:yes gene_type:complete